MVKANSPISKTGVYVWDAEHQVLVRVSDRVRAKPDVFVPQGGYLDENLGHQVGRCWEKAWISSPEQKAAILKEQGLVEDGGWQKKRVFRPVTVDLGAR